jgi:hypothetical protein
MPTYSIKGPDGQTYSINGPAGATREQVIGVIQQKMAAMPDPNRKSTAGEEFMRGLQTTGSAMRTAGEATLGKFRGDESAQVQAGLAGIERGQNIGEKFGLPPGLGPVLDKLESDGKLAAAEEAIAQTPRAFSQQSGPIGAFVGGAKLGSSLMPIPLLKPFAGIAGGFAATSPQFLGLNIERQIQAQLDQGIAEEDVEIDYDLAFKAALAQGAIETVGQAFVLGKGLVRSIVGGNKGRAFAATDKRKLVEAAGRSLSGATGRGFIKGQAEIPVEVAQQVIERYQAKLDVLSDEALSEYGEAAFLAGTVGGSIGSVGGISERIGSRTQLQNQQALEAEQAAATAAATPLIEDPLAAEDPLVAKPVVAAANPRVIPVDAKELKAWGLANLGIGPTATILKPGGVLAGKDLNDPVQAAEVKAELEKYLATLGKDSPVRPKVAEAIRNLEPTGIFTPEGGGVEARKLADKNAAQKAIDDAAAAQKAIDDAAAQKVVDDAAAQKAIDDAAAQKAIDDAAAQKAIDDGETEVIDGETEVRKAAADEDVDDIPLEKSIWSKDLLGFLTTEYEFTNAELNQLNAYDEADMRDYLAEIEAQDGLVFSGPLTDEVLSSTEETVVTEEVEDTGKGVAKDETKAKVLFNEYGLTEADSAALTNEEFDDTFTKAQKDIQLRKPEAAQVTPLSAEKTWEEETDERIVKETKERQKKFEELKKRTAEEEKVAGEEAAKVIQDKKDALAATEEANRIATEAEQTREAKARDKVKAKVDRLAYRNKGLAAAVKADVNKFKSENTTTPYKKGDKPLLGKQAAANYMLAYPDVGDALAVLAAESKLDFTESERFSITDTSDKTKALEERKRVVAAATKAVKWINSNLSPDTRAALEENIAFVEQEIENKKTGAENREREDARNDEDIRKVSKINQSKEQFDFKGVSDGAKGARAVDKKKKKEIGETPAETAKRIKDEEKARLDAEAESLGELADNADQTGTVGYVAAIIRNAEGIAQKAEAELGPKSRSDEWVKFIASLPKTKQKVFLDSYKKIAADIADPEIKLLNGKPKPSFLLPESLRARVVTENKKILSKKDQKRVIKFGEKFLLKTPKYQGPDFSPKIEEQVAAGDLQGAIKSVIAERNKRGDSKEITALIGRINSRLDNTSITLDAATLPNFASGAYLPGLDTVVLSTSTGLNEHTLLHESSHAALAQALNNQNLPITKKFMEFFLEIKLRVGDAYGGTDLQEFAAEYVSNGEFQALLKTIKAPKSENMFIHILQTIAEFFGLRKSQTAYDEAFKFLNDLLDVSQGTEPTLADTLYLGNGNVDQVMAEVTDTLASRSLDKALNQWSNIKDDSFKVTVLGAAGLNNIQSLAKEKLKAPIGALMTALERKRGEVNTKIDSISGHIRQMTGAESKATPAQRKAFNDLAIDSRLLHVDIFKPAPKGDKGKADFKKLTNRYNQLPPGLQETYKTLRNDLDKSLEEYVAIITDLLPESASRELMKEFSTMEGVIAYVPFARSGPYWISYEDPSNLDAAGNPTHTPTSFQSIRERKIEMDRLEAKHPGLAIAQHTNVNSIKAPKGLPEGSFVTKLIGELRNSGVEESTIDQIYQQYITMFPANSIIQQFNKSLNKPGMDRDVITAYSDVAIKWANKIANTKYNPKIEQALQAIETTADAQYGGDPWSQAIKKSLRMQEKFFLNPQFAPLAANMTFLSYLEYIVGSVSSAVVNLTGLMFMVTPMLGARFTYPDALAALNGASSKIKLFALKENNWGTGKYSALYTELDARGLLKHTVAREAIERGKTKGKDFDGTFYKAVEVFSIPFARSEQFMRSVTAVAAFDLAMKSGVPSEGVAAGNEKAAVAFAAKMVRDAHTGGMAETMPRWMQNDFGRVILTFKNIIFQQSYVVGEAIATIFSQRDLPIGVRRVAVRQVLGTFGLSFALLGAKGMPFIGAFATLMNIIAALVPDDEDETEPYDFMVEMEKVFDDYLYNGMLGSVLNVDISARAALANDILWRDDPKSIEDYGYVRTAMFTLGGPMASYAVGAERAITQDLTEGRYGRFLEGISPTFVRNGIKSYRFMQEGARNRDGDPIDTDINAWNLMVQSIGFAPADLSSTYRQRSAAKNYENKVLGRKQRILNKYTAAKKVGDTKRQQEAAEEANKFMRQYPTLMDRDTLERSYKANIAADKNSVAGISFTKGLRYKTDEFFE